MNKYDIYLYTAGVNGGFKRAIQICQKNPDDPVINLINAASAIVRHIEIALTRAYPTEDGDMKQETVKIRVNNILYWEYIENKNIFVAPISMTNNFYGLAVLKESKA